MNRSLPVILWLVLLAGCSDDALKKVSQGLLITAQSIGTLQTTVIEANRLQLISDDDTAGILKLCIQVNQAGKDAVAITKELSKLDNPSKTQILGILRPVITAVSGALESGLAGVKNEQKRQEIRLILLSVQSALNGIQIALAGG